MASHALLLLLAKTVALPYTIRQILQTKTVVEVCVCVCVRVCWSVCGCLVSNANAHARHSTATRKEDKTSEVKNLA